MRSDQPEEHIELERQGKLPKMREIEPTWGSLVNVGTILSGHTIVTKTLAKL